MSTYSHLTPLYAHARGGIFKLRHTARQGKISLRRLKDLDSIADMAVDMTTGAVSLIDLEPKNGKPVIALVSLYSFESLAIRYLTGAVRSAGFDSVEIYYEDFKRNYFKYPDASELEGFISLLREKKVDVVGLSVRSSYRKLAAIITKEIHEKLRLPVIWGSVHATICPEDSISAADAICRGEGEIPIAELLNKINDGKDITGISGLWIKTPDGGVVKNGVSKYIDVNAIADPRYAVGNQHYCRDYVWHEGDPAKLDNGITVMASRGCAHNCSYCSNKFFMAANKGYLRLRKVDNVIREIKSAMSVLPRINRIRFLDDLFACNVKWADEFTQKYKKEINLPFDCLLHPNQISRSLMEKLTEAGLCVVEMGIQHGSDRMANEVYNRTVSNQKLLKAIKTMHESGVRANYDLIIDNPLETEDDKRENLEFMLKIPHPYQLFIYSLNHLPGTPLTERLLAAGLIKESDVEGENDHSLFQWDVSLTYNRSVEDRFWLSLLALVPKSFVPKRFIRFLSRRRILMRHPGPLVAIAYVANIIKLCGLAVVRIREGTFTMHHVRRHVNLREITVK
ncbi:MAG: hypothetical protein IEMM0002_0287 [bacterium]|nr:MAG: hypothetical protein IEMM0002_0287 [bacterium]